MDLVSPHPYWLLQNGLLNGYPSLKEDVRSDVVVLGAGISGAFVTDRLASAGLDVVVLDKRDVGTGSTSASTALLQYEIDTSLSALTDQIGKQDAERAYRLCHDSIDLIERVAAELGVQQIFQRKPSAYLAVKDSECEELRKECEARKKAGIDVEYLDKSEVSTRFSFTRPAALVSTQAAQLDAHRLTHALLSRGEKHGARIFDRTCAEEITPGTNAAGRFCDRVRIP